MCLSSHDFEFADAPKHKVQENLEFEEFLGSSPQETNSLTKYTYNGEHT